MTIDYSEDGKGRVFMPHMTSEIVQQLPAKYHSGPSTTPAASHLFAVNDKADLLASDDADLFHRLMAQLLYLCKRARPELQTVVSFLTTRVKRPNLDDFKNWCGALGTSNGHPTKH